MSIGNVKTEGSKGNNFPWQLKMLLGQQCACDELTAIAGNTHNVEFLLTAILTSLQDGTEYEAKFVVDTCNGDTIYLEVRVWDTDSGTWGPITYYLPGSTTPVIPPGASTPGCMQFSDPTGILAMVLAAIQAQTVILTAIEVDTTAIAVSTAAIDASIDVNLSTVATQTTLAALLTAFNAEDFASQTTLLSLLTAFNLEDFASQTTLAAVNTNLTSVARTPNFLRPTGSSGTIAAGTFSMSFASVGTANATVGGMILKPGETINFDAGALNNTLGAVAYSTTTVGAELIIITLT